LSQLLLKIIVHFSSSNFFIFNQFSGICKDIILEFIDKFQSISKKSVKSSSTKELKFKFHFTEILLLFTVIFTSSCHIKVKVNSFVFSAFSSLDIQGVSIKFFINCIFFNSSGISFISIKVRIFLSTLA